LVMQAVSASRIHLPLVREILLRRRCALLRIRLLDAAGSEKFLKALLATALIARYCLRYENGESASHGDPVSAANSVMITLMFLPLFTDREVRARSMGVPTRGTMFRGAKGGEQNNLISVVLSIGATLAGVPDGTVDGTFKRTGLTKSAKPSALDSHRPILRTTRDGVSVVSLNSTLPHASPLSTIAVVDDRVIMRGGESLVRKLVDVEVLSAMGFASVMVKVITNAKLPAAEMQQLVYETEPAHSLSAQMLMIWCFILPKLSAHAIKLVMGLMHFDELRQMASTKGALSVATGPIEVVPMEKAFSDPLLVDRLTPTRTQRVLVFEVDGMQVTIPVNTAVLVNRKRSCRPHKALALMKANDAQPAQAGTAGAGDQSFRWQ
jgi:hypothetical protein